MKTAINNALVSRMEHATMDAYSYDRYGSRSWRWSIRYLLSRFNEAQTECILRSKVMRWAGDSSCGQRGGIPKDSVKRYYDKSSGNLEHTISMLKAENLI